jgi:hypothetical protein
VLAVSGSKNFLENADYGFSPRKHHGYYRRLFLDNKLFVDGMLVDWG